MDFRDVLRYSLPFAEVQERAHNNLADAAGIRAAAAPETWRSRVPGGPDLARQGSPRVVSGGPECRRRAYDSSVEFEGPDQCFGVARNLVDGDDFVLEAWACALSGNDLGLHAVVANGHGGVGFILGQSGDEWVVLVGGIGFTALAKVRPDTWTHLAIVKSSGAGSGWVDGLRVCRLPALGGGVPNFSIG